MILIFMLFCIYGAIAQLGERFAGSEEVGGSSPPGSTIIKFLNFKSLIFRDNLVISYDYKLAAISSAYMKARMVVIECLSSWAP